MAYRQHSTVVGTFGYMAPEQMRGRANAASDVYALGATIAAAATASDAADLPQAGLEIDLEQCIKAGPIRDTLATMLRADPRERAQSVAEVRRRLDEGPPRPALAPSAANAGANAIVAATPSSLAPPSTLARRRRAILIAAVAASVSMLTGGPPFAVALAAVIGFLIAGLAERFAEGFRRGFHGDD